jgi:hypothetical protein
MNFLAHDVVLPPESPGLTRVGAALPDLWTLLPHRPLPLAVLRELQSNPDSSAAQLAEGIRYHLRADAAFHRHEEFQRRVDRVARRMREITPNLQHKHISAHVLVEMILDRSLITRDPDLVTRYYGAFTSSCCDAASQLCMRDPEARSELDQLLHRFVDSGFLWDYRTAGGLVLRMLRSLSRGGFQQPSSQDASNLERLTDELTVELEPGSLQLLEEIRRVLAARGANSRL